jgi:hypothetical protein
MAWTVRSVIAMVLWAAAGLTFFLVFSGWWIFARSRLRPAGEGSSWS